MNVHMSLTHFYIYKIHLLQLGSDVIQAEVGSQRWSPMLPGGSSDSSSRGCSSAAAAAARPAAAPASTDTVTAAATATATAAPCWLLPAAAACRRLLTDLDQKRKYRPSEKRLIARMIVPHLSSLTEFLTELAHKSELVSVFNI